MQRYDIENHEPSLLPEGKKFKLAFSDEFDGNTLNRDIWNFRLYFWRRRFPAFDDSSFRIRNSCIEFFISEKDGNYSSVQLQTGANSFDKPKNLSGDNPWNEREIWPLAEIEKPGFMHRYGYYEARVKFQKQSCWWSAFWLQSPSIGTTYDPAYSGIECDIMECFNPEKKELTSGNIFGGYGKQYRDEARVRYSFEDTVDGFHRVGVLWTKDEYVFYCDGKETVRTSENVSQVPQFILLTTECQGYRRKDGNTPDERLKNADLSDVFTVDYVRVFDEI